MASRWLSSNEAQRARATRRADAVRAVREQSVVIGGKTDGVFVEMVAQQFGISTVTLRRWMALESDVDGRLDEPRAGRPATAWSGRGAERGWAIWLTDYLRAEKPTGEECYRRVCFTA